MNSTTHDWMKQWLDCLNVVPQEDFWIETPVGSFKNPRFIPEEGVLDNEITITIKYDEWDKNKTIENYE